METSKLDMIAGQLTAVLVAVGKVESRVESAINGHADHEIRLRALEKTKWLTIGFAAAAGGLAGNLGRFLGTG